MKNFSRTIGFALVLVALCAAALLYSPSAFAQSTTGTLRGTVTDPNGNVVAGATVSAKNQATGASSRSVTTTGDGIFVFPDLQPGLYTLTVEPTSGFSRKLITNVDVKIGQDTSIPVPLSPGTPTETVTITASGEEIIQRDQSQISSTFETRRVEELPTNGAGSGLDTLALLAPGVIANRGGGTNTNGTGLSVNGNRGRSNNFQIDGSDNNDLSVAGPALFVNNPDQIQELQVVTNNFSAQYGRNQGAIVNYVTKSGTNQFHGSAYLYHQDQRNLDSLDNLEKRGGQIYPNRSLYNDFGFTAGGPVYLPRFGEGGKSYINGKDKMFFFATYQGIRNPSSFTALGTGLSILPTEFPRLLAAFPGNAAIADITTLSTFAIPGATPRADLGSPQTVFVNPTTGKVFTTPTAGAIGPFLAGGPFDVVNLGGQLFQAAQAQRLYSTPYTENDYSFKFDVKPTNKDSVTFRFLHQVQLNVNSLGTSNGFTGDVPATSKNLGGSYTRQISNTMVNEARASFQRIGVVFGGGETGPGAIPDPTQIGNAIANITFPAVGVTKKGVALSTIGPATNLPQGRIGKVYQVADNLTYTRGRHSFIFGAEFKHLDNLSPFLPNFNGQIGFTSAARLVANAPGSLGLTAGNPLLAFTENDQYYFVQDDFKFRSNLTLNIGLRYEFTGQPINTLNDQSVARESNPATAFYNPALPLSIRTVPRVPSDKHEFAPRVGFAYTPKFWKKLFGEDATVIRGGFSISYDPAFYNILSNVQNGAPFSAALSLGSNLLPLANNPFPLPGGIPTGAVIRASAAASGILPLGKLNPIFLAQQAVAPDFHAPYAEQYSLGIQHQFGKNSVAEVRYVGTHGVGLFQNVNGNFFVGPLLNGFTLAGIKFPAFPQFVPAGVTAQVCKDNPATFDNEAACNGRILPQGGLTIRQNSSQSIYHSMQARYNGRFLANSLTIGATYTFSKTIDDSSEIFAENDVISPNAQNPFCINRCERALSALDRPHVFTTNFLYDVPLMKSQRGFLGHLLGGFQLNGVYILTSGATYTPGQTFNGLLGLGNTYLTAGDRPFVTNPNADPRQVGINQIDAALLFGAPLTDQNGFYSLNQLNSTGNAVSISPTDVRFVFNGPGAAKFFGTPFGSASRNSLRGPIFNQANFSIFKNTRLTERVNLQLRAEFYNVFNHPNPGIGVAATSSNGYLPIRDVGQAGVQGAAFANNGDISLARRVIQFAIRLTF